MGKWDQYLTKISDSQQKCNLCNHRLGGQKKASTAGYICHFKSKHPMEYKKIMGKLVNDEPLDNIDEASSSAKKPRLTQLSIVQSFSMRSEKGQKTRDIERAIMQLICVDALPLQTVEKAGFRNFLKVILPQWKHLKLREFFTRNELPRLFEEYENRLKSELEEVDWLTVSFNIYANEGNIHQVIGVVAHFIKDSTQVNRVLGLIDVKDDSHREVVFKNKVEDLFESFEILRKVVAVIHDGASNVTLAGALLGIDNWDCLSRKINLAAKQGCKACKTCKAKYFDWPRQSY